MMEIDWNKGLCPAVVQDASSLQVLMLGYMNQEALERTLSSGKVTFFSRSKNRLWEKGETSGHTLKVVDVKVDCDSDSVLVRAIPEGPTCHEGTTSCFETEKAPGLGFLAALEQVIARRHRELPKGSYTTGLFEAGIDRMAQKVGEEGVEVAIASKNPELEPLKGEAADLLFHLMVLLEARGLTLHDVVEKLRARHQKG